MYARNFEGSKPQTIAEANGGFSENGHRPSVSPFDKSAFPGLFSLADLLNEELPPAKWIVPDLLPEGVTLLAGKPKMGKSWLALGIAIAVATGGVALGTKPVEQGDVLYLAPEENKRRLQKRTKKIVGEGLPPNIHAALEWPRLDEGGAELISNWCATHPDARLVVIDTLKKIRPRTNGQRSVYDVDYEALEPLVGVAAEQGMAILVVHHLRQMPADDPLDEVSGSTGLTGGVDTCWVLKRDRGKADAYMHVDGRDIEESAELALKWDAQIASWSLLGDADEYRTSTDRQKLKELLENSEPISAKEAALALDKANPQGYNAVRQMLYQMSKSGEAKLVDRGLYTSPNNANNPNNEEAIVSNVSNVRTPSPSLELIS